MKYWRAYLALFGLALCICYTMLPVKSQTTEYVPFSQGLLIAHAGGGLKVEGTYSNSLEALDKAVENGFSYIEVDFLAAENGDLVLLHDWNKTYFRLFTYFPRLPFDSRLSKFVKSKSASDFESLSMRMGLTQLSLDDLILWLQDNPTVYIITDIKDDNLSGLTQIRDKAGDLKSRFIPQIYYFNEYNDVKNLGFEDIILTTYRLKSTVSELREFVESNKLFGLTIPEPWAQDEFLNQFINLDTPIFLHTINSKLKASELIEKRVEGIYTDYLYPGSSSSAGATTK